MVRALKVGVGVLAVALVYGVAANLIHAYVGARFTNNAQIRQRHLREIGTGLLRFEEEHQGRLPERGQWAKSLLRFLDDPNFMEGCEDAAARPPFPCAYLFREDLSGKRADDLPETTWVLQENPSVLPYRPFKLKANGTQWFDRSMFDGTRFLR